jgi:PIN domain nuclease of toxin-antitoxin system
MTVLLDTHALIWWDEDPEKLGAQARAACRIQLTNLCEALQAFGKFSSSRCSAS